MIGFKNYINENVQIQVQDLAGNWRTINMTSNQPQQVLQRMQQVKLVNPKFRVRAIDMQGKLIDILP